MPGTVTHMELNWNPFLGAIRALLAFLSGISEEGPSPALGAFNAKDSSQKKPRNSLPYILFWVRIYLL